MKRLTIAASCLALLVGASVVRAQVDITVATPTYTKTTMQGGVAKFEAGVTNQVRLASHQVYSIPVRGEDVTVKVGMTMKWLDLPQVEGTDTPPDLSHRYFDGMYWVEGDDVNATPATAQQFFVAVPWDWSAMEVNTAVRWESGLTLPRVDKAGRPIVLYRLTENRAIQVYANGKNFDASAVLIDDISLSIGNDPANQTHNPTFTRNIDGWTAQGTGATVSHLLVPKVAEPAKP